MKRQLSAKNVNLIINGAIIVIAALIIWLLISQRISGPDSDLPLTTLPVNEDGSITLFLTEEQLRTSKQNLYDYSQFQNFDLTQSVNKVAYENDLLTKITILVDSSVYRNSLFDRMLCESLLAVSSGTYQVLSGIPPDEWHTTITVKTGEIINKNDFPNENMYYIH